VVGIILDIMENIMSLDFSKPGPKTLYYLQNVIRRYFRYILERYTAIYGYLPKYIMKLINKNE
jgi:hypothetical protein